MNFVVFSRHQKTTGMKKVGILAALISLIAFGCQQQADIYTPQCEEDNQGKVSVRSFQNEAFGIYLNNGYKGTVGAYQTVVFEEITAGTYTLEAREISYVFAQDIYNASVTITACETATVNF